MDCRFREVKDSLEEGGLLRLGHQSDADFNRFSLEMPPFVMGELGPSVAASASAPSASSVASFSFEIVRWLLDLGRSTLNNSGTSLVDRMGHDDGRFSRSPGLARRETFSRHWTTAHPTLLIFFYFSLYCFYSS